MSLVRSTSRVLATSGTMAVLAATPAASAQTRPTAADRAFDEGRTLFARGQVDEACKKFEESEALEPAVGVLFNLADCAVRRGKTKTAWDLTREAGALAARKGDAEREAIAKKQADELAKKLAKIAFTAPEHPLPDRAIVKCDGAPFASARDLDEPRAVDPGAHTIEVSAPGFVAWSRDVSVGAGPTVVVVALADLARENAAPRAPATAPLPEPPRDAPSSSAARPLAWGTAGAGLVALGLGVAFALRARGEWSDVTARCPDGKCPDAATVTALAPKQADAARDGTIGTIGFVAAGALVATSVVLFAVSSRSASVRASASIGPRAAMGVGEVRF